MELEIIISSELSQFYKDKCCIVSLMCGIWPKGHEGKKVTIKNVDGESGEGEVR
jgi:hypothetical protein